MRGRSDTEGKRGGATAGDVFLGVVFALLVHGGLIAFLATAVGASPDGIALQMLNKRLCDGLRCPADAARSDRRGPDSAAAADLGIIEASVIPQLGLAEDTHGLPRLTKYEQPEKLEEAVNIAREPVETKEPPRMDVKRKEAERDKRKAGSLAAILGAPEDDDPRKRATALDRIVGSAQGSVYGSGTESQAGNLYAGKVALAIGQQFTIPPFLSQDALARLRMRVKVTKMTVSGQIQAFEMVEASPDSRFNAAALAAVKRFVPGEGGAAYLPAPDAPTLDYINRRGMVIDLDGALFKR